MRYIAIPAVTVQKTPRLLAPWVVGLMAANITTDCIYAHFQQTAFYLSESVLFSSYWLLLVPLVMLQLWWMQAVTPKYQQLLITVLVTALHLAIYPALVQLLSAVFHEHTFDYLQSFQFGLPAYLVQSLAVYGLGFVVVALRKQRAPERPTVETALPHSSVKPAAPVSSLLIKDSATTQIVLAVTDIHYFSASPPYVMVHLAHKKYLHTATLKGLEAELDAGLFVRIHKSCLLNIDSIVSLESRKNGDYDVTLFNQTVLRVSRNYATHFKQQWLKRTRLGAK